MNINYRRNTTGALTLLALWCVAVAAQPSTLRGKVIGIADGDTLTVLDSAKKQHKIRLQGVDAPERMQAFGTRAREQLAELVFGKQVEVLVDKWDRYRREVGRVRLDGRDINLEMVRAGLAWHYKQYAGEQSAEDREAYTRAEEAARQAKLGLWIDTEQVPPWEFRRGGRPRESKSIAEYDAQIRREREEIDSLSRPVAAAPSPGERPTGPVSYTGAVVGNRRSRIYHLPDCPNYKDVSPQNRVTFKSREEAERTGYRMARNCPP